MTTKGERIILLYILIKDYKTEMLVQTKTAFTPKISNFNRSLFVVVMTNNIQLLKSEAANSIGMRLVLVTAVNWTHASL